MVKTVHRAQHRVNPSKQGRTRRRTSLPARHVSRERPLLERILETPHLAQVIPQLQPEVLHRVIERCGLEDCAELVMLTTPEQLTRILDLDLWRAASAGRDEQFDPDRFGVWLEVLMEAGTQRAAEKLSEMDPDLIVAGLAGHVRVFDPAAVTPYSTLDGDVMTPAANLGDGPTAEIGGFLLAAKRTDAWDALTSILTFLQAEHPSLFAALMGGCRALSYSRPEVDGLDTVLDVDGQAMFDLAICRERRREAQGYSTPAQARAFLQMSRELQLNSVPPEPNLIARAYFQALDASANGNESDPPAAAQASGAEPNEKAAADAVAAVVEVLMDAGIVAPQPRALLNAADDERPHFERLQRHMRAAIDRDARVCSARNQELAYLANVIMAGCSIQARPWTLQEASDAAVAVCNLGLENWPSHWLPAHGGSSDIEGVAVLPEDFLLTHDLVTVFQVGWKVLFDEVAMYVARQLVLILDGLRVSDSDIQTGLDTLYAQLSKYRRDGVPWRARDALEVIAILDMPAWAALLGLIDELPVIHAAMAASVNPHARSVSATAFEFISENSQIAAVREFVRLLPATLGAVI
jgi:hypothetical protein